MRPFDTVRGIKCSEVETICKPGRILASDGANSYQTVLANGSITLNWGSTRAGQKPDKTDRLDGDRNGRRPSGDAGLDAHRAGGDRWRKGQGDQAGRNLHRLSDRDFPRGVGARFRTGRPGLPAHLVSRRGDGLACPCRDHRPAVLLRRQRSHFAFRRAQGLADLRRRLAQDPWPVAPGGGHHSARHMARRCFAWSGNGGAAQSRRQGLCLRSSPITGACRRTPTTSPTNWCSVEASGQRDAGRRRRRWSRS